MSLALHYWMGDAHHCSAPPPVSEMTHTVSSGTLNPSIPYHYGCAENCSIFPPDTKSFSGTLIYCKTVETWAILQSLAVLSLRMRRSSSYSSICGCHLKKCHWTSDWSQRFPVSTSKGRWTSNFSLNRWKIATAGLLVLKLLATHTKSGLGDPIMGRCSKVNFVVYCSASASKRV